MIKNRHRWLIVPSILSAGALAFACSSSSGDDSATCTSGTCSGNDGGGVDATTQPTDGATSSDGSGDGAVKVGGPPIMLGQHLKTPYNMTVDATYVYIAEDVTPNARALRVPIDGSTAMETIASGFGYASAIAVDSTNAYIGEGSSGKIYEFPLSGSPDGGVPPPLTSGSLNVGGVMAITATHLYWGTGDYGGAIYSYAFGVDAGATVFGGTKDEGITIDSTDMFWGNQYEDSVSTRSLGPDAAPQQDLVLPQGLEGADNQMTEVRPLNGVIYWGQTSSVGGGIYSFPIAPQIPPISPQLLATDSNTPWHLSVDTKYVYWISDAASPPGLQYIPLAGGPTKLLVTTTDESIFSFTQDANYIYYTHGTDPNDATLVRITKPD